jgi:hypothetical protein
MSRSQNSYGRVRRAITSKGIEYGTIQDEEIYDELAKGQLAIFSRVNFERKYDLSLLVGAVEYPLVSQVDPNDRIYIKGIKNFITPTAWRYKFEYVPNTEWNSIIENTHYPPQPIRATLFDNKLEIFPAPLVIATLTVWTVLKAPETDIALTVKPELDMEWDGAMEDYALYRLLGDVKYFQAFEEKVKTLQRTTVGKGDQLVKARSW